MSIEFAERYGPRAVVAGGSDGIGAGFARGVSLVPAARRAVLEAFAAKIQGAHPVGVRTAVLDLSDAGAMAKLAAETTSLEVGLFGRGRGGLILLSSRTAWAGAATVAAYGATKAFDIILAEGLWAEWRGRGADVDVLGGGPARPAAVRGDAAPGGRAAAEPAGNERRGEMSSDQPARAGARR